MRGAQGLAAVRIALCVCAAAQAVAMADGIAGPITTLKPIESPRESFQNKDIPVGGHELSGVLTGNLDDPADPDRLQAMIPNLARPGLLCVAVRSRDGRYEAAFQYRLPANRTGLYLLDLKSRYAAELRRFRAADLGAVAEIRDASCQGSDDAAVLVPLSWNAAPSHDIVIYLIKSADVDADILTASGMSIAQCSALQGVAYNAECRLRWPAGLDSLILRRRFFETVYPAITLRVRFP